MECSNRQCARDILSNVQYRDDADYHVYVLEICRYDGETFYYVGMTSDPLTRMISHISDKSIYMPSAIGEMRADVEYEIISLTEMIDVFGTRERARNMERTRALELAIELESTNVLGGS